MTTERKTGMSPALAAPYGRDAQFDQLNELAMKLIEQGERKTYALILRAAGIKTLGELWGSEEDVRLSVISELQKAIAAAENPLEQNQPTKQPKQTKLKLKGPIKVQHRGKDMSPFHIGVPGELHPSTTCLVLDTANMMAQKLYRSQVKYGFKNGWQDTQWEKPKDGAIVTGAETCRSHAFGHMLKGDPIDVANYMAFMMYHGWDSSPQSAEEAKAWIAKLNEKFDLVDDAAIGRLLMEKMEERHGDDFNYFFEAIMLRVLMATGLKRIDFDLPDLFAELAGKNTTGHSVEIVESVGQLSYILRDDNAPAVNTVEHTDLQGNVEEVPFPRLIRVNWLDDCPVCKYDHADVETFSAADDYLNSGDKVTCPACGLKGVIDADDNGAYVSWEETL